MDDYGLYTQVSTATHRANANIKFTLTPLLNVVAANLDELVEGSPEQQATNIKILLDSLVEAQYHTRVLLKDWLYQVAWFPKEYEKEGLLVIGVKSLITILETIRDSTDVLFYGVMELSHHPDKMESFSTSLRQFRDMLPRLLKI